MHDFIRMGRILEYRPMLGQMAYATAAIQIFPRYRPASPLAPHCGRCLFELPLLDDTRVDRLPVDSDTMETGKVQGRRK